jgi:hypothetical protein
VGSSAVVLGSLLHGCYTADLDALHVGLGDFGGKSDRRTGERLADGAVLLASSVAATNSSFIIQIRYLALHDEVDTGDALTWLERHLGLGH